MRQLMFSHATDSQGKDSLNYKFHEAVPVNIVKHQEVVIIVY